MEPRWGTHGTFRPQMRPMLALWTLISRKFSDALLAVWLEFRVTPRIFRFRLPIRGDGEIFPQKRHWNTCQRYIKALKQLFLYHTFINLRIGLPVEIFQITKINKYRVLVSTKLSTWWEIKCTKTRNIVSTNPDIIAEYIVLTFCKLLGGCVNWILFSLCSSILGGGRECHGVWYDGLYA